MTSPIITKLRDLARSATESSEKLTPALDAEFSLIRTTIERFEASWSGSQIGYHANVYYKNFQTPPSGHRFSPEWGLQKPQFMTGSVGLWHEYPFQEVIDRILIDAGSPDLAALETVSVQVKNEFTTTRDSLDSLLTLTEAKGTDAFISRVRSDLTELTIPIVPDAVRFQYRPIPSSSRDSLAVHQGAASAPHQELLAKIVVFQAPFKFSIKMAKLCNRLADHLEMVENTAIAPALSGVRRGSAGGAFADPNIHSRVKVFIGHGRSQEWRKLKEYLSETLQLECDEFNRVPIAGVTNIERLNAMLDDARIAIVVMTSEDEVEGGAPRARENVIHEAGLFQGRLGFEKTILLLESTCNIFSNIDGLGRIEFSHGNIEGTFEKVRAVLVREGIVEI